MRWDFEVLKSFCNLFQYTVQGSGRQSSQNQYLLVRYQLASPGIYSGELALNSRRNVIYWGGFEDIYKQKQYCVVLFLLQVKNSPPFSYSTQWILISHNEKQGHNSNCIKLF